MHPIGEAARRSGVTVETIRYYERTGLVPPPDRAESGRRLYDSEAVGRLRFFRRCRDHGFPLRSVGALLALAADEDAACADVKRIGEMHLVQVREKIAELSRLEDSLSALVRQCDAGRNGCAALRRLFDGTD